MKERGYNFIYWRRKLPVSEMMLWLLCMHKMTIFATQLVAELLEKLEQHIEALIFAADHPITLEEIGNCLEEVLGVSFSGEEIQQAIEQLQQRYAGDTSAFDIAAIGSGYQFLTKGAYHHTVSVYLKQTTRKRLSRTALETLAIIAYRQPVSKSDLERIRGVNSDYAIQKLLEKELVAITGRSDGPGRPLLYGTTDKFMDYFGLRSLDELPKLKELVQTDNKIGDDEAMEEEVNPG